MSMVFLITLINYFLKKLSLYRFSNEYDDRTNEHFMMMARRNEHSE